MRRWLIEKLGGYADLEVALRAVPKEDVVAYAIDITREMPLPGRQEWLTLAVRRLFNTIGPDDIFKIQKDGTWTWKGKAMREDMVDKLKAEAGVWEQSFLWMVLQAELKYQANRRMFTTSVGDMDLTAGKLLVYYIDVVKTKVEEIVKK